MGLSKSSNTPETLAILAAQTVAELNSAVMKQALSIGVGDAFGSYPKEINVSLYKCANVALGSWLKVI